MKMETSSSIPCRSVAVLNMKGGVGKTTLSVNLARYLARSGNRVLLVDLDPQSNATIVCMSEEERKRQSNSITDFFIDVYEPRVSIATKEKDPISLEKLVFSVPLTDFYGDKNHGKLDFIRSDLWLSSVLRGVPVGPFSLDSLLTDAVKKRYDYIFFDCAPTYSLLTSLALNTAKSVLIPMIPDEFGRYGTDLMKKMLKEHLYDYDVKVGIVGVVFTMINLEKKDEGTKEGNEIIESWPDKAVFTSQIARSDWYRELGNDSKFSREDEESLRAKSEFEAFVQEFEMRAAEPISLDENDDRAK